MGQAKTPAQRRFKAAVVAAVKKCVPETVAKCEGKKGKAECVSDTFRACRNAAMRAALKGKGTGTGKGKGKAKKAAKKGTASKAACAGIVQSGPKKGKMKKGYRWKKGGGCPIKVAA